MNFKTIVSFVTKLSKRERIIFYVTVSLVSLVLVDKFILSPIFNKISYLTEIINEQEESIQQSMLIVTQEKRIKDETKRYALYLSKPQTEEKQITEFLKEIENIAKRSSVYLVDMKPSNTLVESNSTQYFVRLNFEAKMEEVMNFFYHVSNYKQLIKIEEFLLKPKTEGSNIISCTLSISKSIVPE